MHSLTLATARAEANGRVGSQGQGAKLTLQATGSLIVITKADPKASLWDVAEIVNPRQILIANDTPAQTPVRKCLPCFSADTLFAIFAVALV